MTTDESFENDFYQYIEKNTELYISRLAEAVAMKSISSDLDNHLKDIEDMMDWTKGHIERLKGKATLLPNPASTAEKKLPPILLGEFMVDEKKKTVCVYGHLDVQPAAKEDGWDTDPFVLTEKDGKLYGRGSTDDKGPALSWLWVIEAHSQLGIELPVNVKLIFEGMEVRCVTTLLSLYVLNKKRMMYAPYILIHTMIGLLSIDDKLFAHDSFFKSFVWILSATAISQFYLFSGIWFRWNV